MLRKLKKKGFVSIVEVIVTSVIFILAAFGILSSISKLSPAGVDTSKRLDAAYVGRKFIENLRNSVTVYASGTRYSNKVAGGLSNYTVNWYLRDDINTGTRQMFMNVYY